MDSKTSAAASGPKPQNKLGPVGAAILEEYWSKHASPTLPPLPDRRELTIKIKELPGYANFWNDNKTTDWFRRRCRKQTLQAGTSNTVTQTQNADAFRDTIQLLDVLLMDQPNPTSDAIKAWATLLARNAGNAMTVETWVVFLQHLIGLKSAALPDTSLPKSVGTVQSTDSAVSFDKMKRDPADSPVLPPLSVPEAFCTEKQSPSPPLTGETYVSPSKHAGTLQAIIEDVLEAFPDAPDCNLLPTNSDEYEAMFAPYEQKLTRLLYLLESEPTQSHRVVNQC